MAEMTLPERTDEPMHMPEAMPSAMSASEPTTPRFFGMLGLGAVVVGGLALALNNYGPRLVGPNVATVLLLFGVAAMLYHAVRDADQMVRRGYLSLGFAALGAGIALSIIPRTGVLGDWFLPWGAIALLLGLFFVLGAGRHEEESPWTGLASGFLLIAAVAATAVGLIGIGYSIDFVPRFTGLAIFGLMFWSAAVGRTDTTSDRGYRLGQLLGLVGIAALLYGVGRSAVPSVLYSMGAVSQMPGRYFVPQGLMLTTLGALALLISFAICSDRPLIAMTRRELAAFFYSPVAYLVLLGSAFVGWMTYVQFLNDLLDQSGMGRSISEPIVQRYIVNLVPVFAIMFIIPAITMRLFAEERRTGTIEVLLTSPVSETSVVLSKFFAALAYFFVLLLPWGLFLIPIYRESRDGFDYLPLLSFYVALLCSGAAFVSMGVFFSSLTRNQIIAAALTFAGMVAYLSAYIFALQTSGAIRSVLEQFSFVNVWLSALEGKLYLHNALTYLSVTAFWLFLSVKAIEARKWN